MPLFLTSQSTTTRALQFFLVLILGLLFISLLNFFQAVRPKRMSIQATPSDYGLNAEEVHIEAPDGTDLSAWYIPAESAKQAPALILLHGYPAEKADMLSLAARLHPDFSLLLLDLRYFGGSEGWATTLGVQEPRDVQAATAFLQEKAYNKIGIFGFSFGGAVALMTAAKEPAITAVGAYAAYADLRQLGYDTFSILPGIRYPLVELMNMWGGIFFGDFPFSASPLKAAQNLDIPVLLIHSKEDEQIPFAHGKKLQKALQNNRHAEFMFMDHGRHGVLPPDFFEHLLTFFNPER